MIPTLNHPYLVSYILPCLYLFIFYIHVTYVNAKLYSKNVKQLLILCLLYLKKKSNTRKNPLGGLALGLEAKSPNIGGTSLTSLVHRAVVQVSHILLILHM